MSDGVVIIDGEVFPSAAACVPVLDRGFLYGDSVYEVIRTYNGSPFALTEHLERLERSASLVEMNVPMSRHELAQQVLNALQTAGDGEWYIRVIVTRGAGPIGLDPALAEGPRCIVVVLPLQELPSSYRVDGVGVSMVAISRAGEGAMPMGAKTGNYLTNIMVLRQARAHGCFEAIQVDASGQIAEGTTSNVFIVTGGVIRTPPLAAGILDGITRRKVIALCEEDGLELLQAHLRPLDVYSADEIFLTGTLKEVLPVTRVDGKKVGDGRPGPITARLAQLYRNLAKTP
jgi:branched-chain amino acid aminotransferase